jgi:hypothetical protein
MIQLKCLNCKQKAAHRLISWSSTSGDKHVEAVYYCRVCGTAKWVKVKKEIFLLKWRV